MQPWGRTVVQSPSTHISAGRTQLPIPVIPALRRQKQGIPGASWLAKLAKLASSRFKWENLPQYIRWRVAEEDSQCQPLAPICIPMYRWAWGPSSEDRGTLTSHPSKLMTSRFRERLLPQKMRWRVTKTPKTVFGPWPPHVHTYELCARLYTSTRTCRSTPNSKTTVHRQV